MHPERSDMPPAASFSPRFHHLASLERTVVALGLRDPLWSVPGLANRFHRWLHVDGQGERLHLANPRLERLRRFIVLQRHGRTALDDQDNPGPSTLLITGFTQGQIREAQILAGLTVGN